MELHWKPLRVWYVIVTGDVLYFTQINECPPHVVICTIKPSIVSVVELKHNWRSILDACEFGVELQRFIVNWIAGLSADL